MRSFDGVGVDELRRGGGINWQHPGDVIGSSVAEMDLGTAPEVTAVLAGAVAAGRLGHASPRQVAALAEATARWQAERHGWAVDPGSVHVTGGVMRSLELVLAAACPPPAAVVVPTPAFAGFLSVPRLLGRRVVEVASGGWGPDPDVLERVLLPGDLLVLCQPHNPTGRVPHRDELAALAEVVARRRARVFADEVFGPVTLPGARHVPYASTSATAAAHTFTALSAAKAWNLSGLRCAQLVAGTGVAAAWAGIAPLATAGASTPGIEASTAAYDRGGPWLDDVVALLDRNRRALADLVGRHLPGAGYAPPQGTSLAWLDLTALGLGDDPAGYLRGAARVELADGRDMGAGGAGHVRLNLGMPGPVLEELIGRMGHAVSSR